MENPAGSAHLIRFGPFELDPLTRELRTNGRRISLQEQPFQILLALVERPGQLVSRQELTNRLWPAGTFVDFERSLNTAVNRLRGALEDPAEDSRFIESLPRRGYRFIATVALDGPEKTDLPASHAPVDGVAEAGQEIGTQLMSTPSGGFSRKKLTASLVSVLLAISAIAVLVIHFRITPPRAQRHSVVLADFTNTTGDPIFEGTLRQGLAVQLEQSPFLDTASDDQIAQTLRLMGQSAETKLTGLIAREICRREGGSAWLDGSIANVEGEYVVGLRAVNCQNSATLAQVQATAVNKKEVLKALSRAASQLRTKLGESLASMQKFDTSLDLATTPSLEALQAYTLGRKALWRTDNADAVLLFQRATQLDPNFALAYSSLGETYVNLGQTVLGAQNSKKAYDLRSQVSEREKLYIESHYLENVVGNLDKARDVYELWAQTYPNDLVPRVNLAGIYVERGQYDRSLAEEKEAFRIDPANGSIYADLVVSYIYLNRLDEAEATFREAMAKNLDNPRLHTTMYILYFLRNNDPGMMQEVSWGAGKPGAEEILFALEAETAAWRGWGDESKRVLQTRCSFCPGLWRKRNRSNL